MADEAKFSSWAIVELLGHRRVAGLVSEAVIGGSALIRVDIPEITRRRSPWGTKTDTETIPAFTQYYGPGSVYCLTPCSEAAARAAAEGAPSAMPLEIRELPAPPRREEPEEGYDQVQAITRVREEAPEAQETAAAAAERRPATEDKEPLPPSSSPPPIPDDPAGKPGSGTPAWVAEEVAKQTSAYGPKDDADRFLAMDPEARIRTWKLLTPAEQEELGKLLKSKGGEPPTIPAAAPAPTASTPAQATAAATPVAQDDVGQAKRLQHATAWAKGLGSISQAQAWIMDLRPKGHGKIVDAVKAELGISSLLGLDLEALRKLAAALKARIPEQK